MSSNCPPLVHAYAHLTDKYVLCPRRKHGRSLRADGRRAADPIDERRWLTIAVPGTMTTAYLALRLCEPEFKFIVVPFDQDRARPCVDGRVDAGLIIHEGQLTYGDRA